MIKRKLISLGLSITLFTNILSSLFSINSNATNTTEILENSKSTTANEWISSLGGSGEDCYNSIIKTSDGGYVAVGYTESTDISGITNNGNRDALIVKYDKSGNQLWAKSYGGTITDSFADVIETTDGGYIAVGYSSIYTGSAQSYYDATIVKYDKDGNMVWQKNWGGSKNDYFYSITATLDGGFAVCGDTISTDISGITSKGNTDGIIVKFNSSGTQQWIKNFGGSSLDYFYEIVQLPDGSLAIAGKTTSYDINGLSNRGYNAGVVVKYDKNGNQLWSNFLNGYGEDIFNSLTTLDDGSIVAVGYTESTDISGITNNGSAEGVVVKYNSSGSQQWIKSWGGVSRESFEGVTRTFNGGIAVSGYAYTNSIDNYTNRGYSDFIVVEYDKDGNKIYSNMWGGNNLDYANDIIQAPDGTFVIAGQSKSTNIGFTNKGGNDAIISTKIGYVLSTDRTPPILDYELSPKGETTGEVTITITITDDSGVSQVVLPDKSMIKETNPVTYKVNANGTYTFTATDNNGNSASIDVIVSNIIGAVDTEPPTITHTLSPNTWTNGDVTINIIAEDKNFKEITLPNGNIVKTETVSYTVSNNGTYTFKATDESGNSSNLSVRVSKIDKKKPDINAQHNTEWTNQDVNVTLSAEDF